MLTILFVLFTGFANGQVSFSPIDSKLNTQKKDDLTELICSGSTLSVRFQLERKVMVLQQNNFVTIDSQLIQITPLKFSGYLKDSSVLSLNDQRKLLGIYSKYEMEYFTNDLNLEILNPNNQWVMIKSKGWFIWYFRVGGIPTQVESKTKIQLFASTVIGDKILTVNAPIPSEGDFAKAGLIVNEMMETLTIILQ